MWPVKVWRGSLGAPLASRVRPLGSPWAPLAAPRAPQAAPRAPFDPPWFPSISHGPLGASRALPRNSPGSPLSQFCYKIQLFFNISGTPRNYETSPREKKRGSWAPPGPPGNSARRPEGGRGPPRKTTKITRGGPGPPRGSKFSGKARPGPPPRALWRFFKNVVFPKEKHTF